MARRGVLLAVVLSALVVVTGASAAAPRVRLTVYAAADLAFALKEITAAFERTFNVDVILVLGSTGNLAHQIEHGAPADLFFAASDTFIDRLVERGAVLRETRAIYAQGRIVLATARSAGTKLTDLRQLAEPRVRRVAIANPLHAPYGKAAEEALRRAGVLDAVRPKLILAENIRQALQFLQTGSADAGIVALSVAGVPEIEWVPIDPALHSITGPSPDTVGPVPPMTLRAVPSFIEPSPYEVVGMLTMLVFGLTGLSLRAAVSPLALALIVVNIGYAITVPSDGLIYVGGFTRDTKMPMTDGAYSTTVNGTGSSDGFVMVLDTSNQS